MSIRSRLARLERAAPETGTLATVLITDADGGDFLNTQEDYDDLVITTGTFTNHQFDGGLRPPDEAAIANLRKEYNTVVVHKIDGYHLRLCHQAYKAALERATE